MVTEPSSPMTAQPPLDRRERGAALSINESGPAIARATARIDAGPEIVVRILFDVANWSSWQHGVSLAEIDRPVSLGATFRWKTCGSWIMSTVELFDPPSTIGWRGRTFGTRAIHVWRLVPDGSGMQVDTEESFEGWLVSLLTPLMRRFLRRRVDTAIADLEREANAVSSTGSQPGGSTSLTSGGRALSFGAAGSGR